jgi:hypothetical protein
VTDCDRIILFLAYIDYYCIVEYSLYFDYVHFRFVPVTLIALQMPRVQKYVSMPARVYSGCLKKLFSTVSRGILAYENHDNRASYDWLDSK